MGTAFGYIALGIVNLYVYSADVEVVALRVFPTDETRQYQNTQVFINCDVYNRRGFAKVRTPMVILEITSPFGNSIIYPMVVKNLGEATNTYCEVDNLKIEPKGDEV